LQLSGTRVSEQNPDRPFQKACNLFRTRIPHTKAVCPQSLTTLRHPSRL